MTQPRTIWRRALLVASIVIAVAVWRYETPSEAATAPAARPDAAANPSALAPAATPVANAPGPAERRLDLAALRRSLAGRADAGAELQRIVAFARFRDQVAEYGRDRASLSDADRRALARQILDALPDHVARGEIVPVQAEALSAALLIDAEPDPATRSAAVQSMQRQWDGYAQQTVGPSPAQDPRYQTYAQQSRDIVQQVQASVADPEQQQVVIGQRLQALRVQLFDGGPPAGAH
ncbi:phospholipase C accessory protein PlcR [Burkholderia alba]|uniref:phospholipase C accessory protein PlcR n=1 Tax=Burkholderia alba TaxID=2683677 RepID=UPI002B05F98E|nr:phospholipase C accessory protein PlcR [Burkholderia alba]